jgi:NHLM bacteriocin system ABC transporter peptidase/ATP-binding protein
MTSSISLHVSQRLARQPKQRVKTPTVLQMEAVECGAAALGIVLGYHGRHVPLEELRVACGVSRDGSIASNIVKAGRRYGLEAKGFRQKPEGLRDIPKPAILHWNFNHFLVLEGFSQDKVYLNDPATGPRTVAYAELDEAFTGVVLVFEKGSAFTAGGQKASLVKALSARLRGSEIPLLYVVLVSLALVIPGLLAATFSRIFVDYYLVGGLQKWLGALLGVMAVTAVVSMALTWIQQRYLLRLEGKLAINNASRLFWHILRLPIEFFTQRSAGDINSRVDMNDRVAQLLSGEMATALLNVILMVFYALLMLQYSVPLTIIGIVMALINFVFLRYVSRKRVDINQKLVQERAKLLSTAFSGLQSIETIKATGGESDFFARWAGHQAKMNNATQELGISTQVLAVVPLFLSMVTTILVLTVGGMSVMTGVLSVGMLVACQSLMNSFLNPVTQMVNLGGQLQEIQGIIGRLDDVFNYQPDEHIQVAESPQNLSDQQSKLSGAVELRDITFGYSRLAPPLIENFTLKLEPGARVALVGGSGSGKSTVARLVAGLYEPWEGEILFDGKLRQQFPRAVVNNSLAVVDQDIFLFEGSVRDNLTMWDAHVSDEDMIRAAKDAHIHEEIEMREGNYSFQVEEGGGNFSGGQRQRLEIARALVNNPAILVLDEATSALDPVTEQIIDDHLRRRGCTCLIVAHRLSTIRDCDEILVLDRGRVVQRGTHEELRRSQGLYAQLIKAETSESESVLDSLWERLAA